MADQLLKELEDKKKEAESLLIIGVFSLIVSAVLFLAIFFTNTSSGKMANFLVGLVLFILSIFFFAKGKKIRKDA